jgi:hypothetical protein
MATILTPDDWVFSGSPYPLPDAASFLGPGPLGLQCARC